MTQPRAPLCTDCDDTGYREAKNPIPSLVYCHCQKGQDTRKTIKERDERERQAIDRADLWNNPEQWPW